MWLLVLASLHAVICIVCVFLIALLIFSKMKKGGWCRRPHPPFRTPSSSGHEGNTDKKGQEKSKKKEKEKEGFAEEKKKTDEDERIVIPKVCVGGYCIEGEDVGKVIAYMKNVHDDFDTRIQAIEKNLQSMNDKDEDLVKTLSDIESMRSQNVRDIQQGLNQISTIRRNMVEQFESKIETMKREREQAAKLVDNLVEKRIDAKDDTGKTEK